MKNHLSLWIIPLLILISGCSTRVSTQHRHGHSNHHNSHVSVGLHGRTSGAGILGALIVGGIIGSIIHDNQHREEQDAEQAAIEGQNADELTNGYPVNRSGQQPAAEEQPSATDPQDEFDQAKQGQSDRVEWYQVGKDGKCYLMAVSNGITDVVAVASDSKCKN